MNTLLCRPLGFSPLRHSSRKALIFQDWPYVVVTVITLSDGNLGLIPDILSHRQSPWAVADPPHPQNRVSTVLTPLDFESVSAVASHLGP